jgi:hypothetical protein
MTTKYQREAKHERAILERYEKQGMSTMRSAGSKGWVDGIAWNSELIYFVCSRHSVIKQLVEIWPEDDRVEYLKNIICPDNGFVIFFGLGRLGEKVWIYNTRQRKVLLDKHAPASVQ